MKSSKLSKTGEYLLKAVASTKFPENERLVQVLIDELQSIVLIDVIDKIDSYTSIVPAMTFKYFEDNMFYINRFHNIAYKQLIENVIEYLNNL